MKVKKLILYVICTLLFMSSFPFAAIAQDGDDARMFFIDGENITRWADTAVVYRNKPTTEQNEWGINIVVGADGKVTKIVNHGDVAGKNLAIPAGGMVVSGTGTKVDWFKENVSVGDFAYYDKISSRVLFSKTGVFSPFFSINHAVTGFNQVRYSNTFIIYDNSGATTETNGYGYELSVSSEGKIITSGGNNLKIPDGGFVVSAVEVTDKQFLKMYGIVGASVKISADKKSVTISYGKENLKDSLTIKADNLKAEIQTAKDSYMLIPSDEILGQLESLVKVENANSLTLGQRNELFEKIDNMRYLINESPAVELRGIWHDAIEKNEKEVKKVVDDLKKAGINQLNIGISSGYDTIIPLPADFPFKQRSSLKGFDLLESYVKECKEAGIELVASVSIFRNSAGKKTTKPEWLTSSNGRAPEGVEDETGYFFNPANSEYREYMLKYLTYILENYNIDGLQLDYIRYAGATGTLDYGYDALTKKLFAQKYGVDESVVDEIGKSLSTHSMWKEWCEFRTEQVTGLVKEIRALVNTKRPDIYLSAAVASDTRIESFLQDTANWMKEGLLDAIYPMTYGEGVVEGRVDAFRGLAGDKAYVFMGIGSYIGLPDSETFKQTITSRYKADGAAYFEYLSYLSHGTSTFLTENAYKDAALSPTFKATEAVKAQIDFIIKRISEAILKNGGISDDKAESVIGKLTALKETLTAEKTASAISEIESLISGEKCETILKEDLAKLTKIILLSKDAQKAEYKPVDKTDKDKTTSDTSVDSDSKNDVKNNKSGNWLWIALGVVAAAAVAVGIIAAVKKKRN